MLSLVLCCMCGMSRNALCGSVSEGLEAFHRTDLAFLSGLFLHILSSESLCSVAYSLPLGTVGLYGGGGCAFTLIAPLST